MTSPSPAYDGVHGQTPGNQPPRQSDNCCGGDCCAPPLSRGVLLRCAADDELSPEDRVRLERHLCDCPGDDACIRFERQLRQACNRAMCACEVPPALRDAVAAKLAAGHAPVVIARIGPAAWFGRWGLAIAAVLVVGVGTTLMLRINSKVNSGDLSAGVNGTAAAIQLSNFYTTEHDTCLASQEALSQRLEVTDPAALPRRFQQLLGQPISPELMASADFHFVGAGSCSVPGADDSVHLLYRRVGSDGKEGPLVSVFIVQDAQRLGLAEGKTYALKEGRERVYAWVSDGLVYYVVTRCSKSCDAARKELHAPPTVAQLGGR